MPVWPSSPNGKRTMECFQEIAPLLAVTKYIEEHSPSDAAAVIAVQCRCICAICWKILPSLLEQAKALSTSKCAVAGSMILRAREL